MPALMKTISVEPMLSTDLEFVHRIDRRGKAGAQDLELSADDGGRRGSFFRSAPRSLRDLREDVDGCAGRRVRLETRDGPDRKQGSRPLVETGIHPQRR